MLVFPPDLSLNFVCVHIHSLGLCPLKRSLRSALSFIRSLVSLLLNVLEFLTTYCLITRILPCVVHTCALDLRHTVYDIYIYIYQRKSVVQLANVGQAHICSQLIHGIVFTPLHI